MKKFRKLLALSCALSILAIPSNAFAATTLAEGVKTSREMIGTHYVEGILLYNNVILNYSLGSDNYYMGQVNYGDKFCVHGTQTTSQGRWLYVCMLTGQNAGRWGWIFRDYTNY